MDQIRRALLGGLAALALTLGCVQTASAAVAGVPPLYFGANVHPRSHSQAYNDNEIDQMWVAGVKTVRMDINWCDIETFAKGQYRMEEVYPIDRYVQRLVARGMEPMMVVTNSPKWARTTGTTGGCGPNPAPGQPGEYAVPPTNANDYADFLVWLIKRYDGRTTDASGQVIGRVPSFEIWQEPDGWWAWTQNGNQVERAVRYTDLLKTAYFRAKAVDPNVRILGEVASRATPDAQLFIAGLIYTGALNYMDAVAVHLYNDDGSDHLPYGTPEDLFNEYFRYVYSALYTSGLNKPVWVTEIGYNTATWYGAITSNAFLYRSYFQAMQRFGNPWLPFPIERQLVYEWADGPSDYWDNHYGLVAADGVTQKPAYDAFFKLAHANL